MLGYDETEGDEGVERKEELYPEEARLAFVLYIVAEESEAWRNGAWGAGREGVRDVAVTW